MSDVTNFKLGDDIYSVKDSAARDSIVTINRSLGSMQSDINTSNSKITALENRMNPFNNFENVIFFGDSYGQGWSPDGAVPSWEDKLLDMLPNVKQSAKINGGGIGFSHVSTSISQNALQCWNANKNNVTWLGNATAIIVMLGVNDSDQQESSIIENATNFFEQLKADCPDAIIYYFYNTDYTVRSRSACGACYRAAYNHSYVRCFESAWWVLLQDSFFTSDFKHPNETGHRIIAEKMYDALNGVQPCNLIYLNISDVEGFVFNVFVTNDTVRIYLSGNVSASRSNTIGHFPAKFFDNRTGPAIATQDVVGLLTTGTTFGASGVIAFGGSGYGNSIYFIHIGSDLTEGNCRFCKTFNVYSFFGE